MTISYSDAFSTLLLRWKGSLYKAVIRDIFMFYVFYYIIFIIQRLALDEDQKKLFTKVIKLFDKGTEYIPLTFLLGFFVAGIVARWWEQFNWISWPDKLMTVVAIALPGINNKKTRRLIARWANLQAAIAWRGISVRTIKRFPTLKHLVDAGLMTQREFDMFADTNAPYGKWFLPTIWTVNLLRKCLRDGDMNIYMQKRVLDELLAYREGFAKLFLYDWVKIPLVYTQVVAIAAYGYFALCLISRQPKLDAKSQEEFVYLPLGFPLFTTLQILFYMGWLKVGQYLMSPFGEDDDDFELNYIIDRHIHTSYMIADELHDQLPLDDDETILDRRRQLPHTKASIKVKDVAPRDPFAKFKLCEEDMEQVRPEGHHDFYEDELKFGKQLRHIGNSFKTRLSRSAFKARQKTFELDEDGVISEMDETMEEETLKEHKNKDVADL